MFIFSLYGFILGFNCFLLYTELLSNSISFSLKKERPRLTFFGIYRTITLPNKFWLIYCYEVSFVKKCNKPLLQLRETKIFEKKDLSIFFSKSTRKAIYGVLKINQGMCKLLILSQRLQWNWKQVTAVVYIATLYFEHSKHFPYLLGYYIMIHHSWKLVTSYNLLYYLYVVFKRNNQCCWSSNIIQSLNVE